MGNEFYWPKPTERLAIMGRTGSGKTQLGGQVLSTAPFDKMPYVIMDYKRDELLNKIKRTREIGLNEIPKKPGLYIIHNDPGFEDETEKWLFNVWRRGRVGLYFDETYLVPDQKALQAILTQGRSLRIPAICVSQRPVQVSRFVFSEADHVAVFHLNDDRDVETVKKFTPRGFVDYVPPEHRSVDYPRDTRLPNYHSRWYDIKNDRQYVLKPVPTADDIVKAIDARLQPSRRWL